MTNIVEATSLGATSTTEDVLSGVNLKGKRVLVTGVFGRSRRGNGAISGRARRSGSWARRGI
jgi:hypothetical protein